jgi:hypothetical protein
MVENNEKDNGSGDTLSPADFPLASPESRAAARFRLREIPHVVTTYVESSPDGTPVECDPVSAKIGGGGLPELIYERGERETVAEFKSRVYDDLPVGEPLRLVSFLPRKDSPN